MVSNSQPYAQQLISRLPKAAQEIIRGNAPPDKYPHPSDADHSLVAFMVRRGFSVGQVGCVLQSSCHDSRYRALLKSDPAKANQWLKTDYEEAKRASKAALGLFKWVMTHPRLWKSKKGLNEKHVLIAHIKRCEHEARINYHLSIREAALEARVTTEVAWRCKQSLVELGVIREIAIGRGELASTYRLVYKDEKHELGFMERRLKELYRAYNLKNYGVFRTKPGLGKAAYDVLVIINKAKLSQKEVVRLSGISKGSVSKAIQKLVEHKLVRLLQDGCYTAQMSEASMKRVAEKLGTVALDARQGDQVAKDRQAYKAMRENRAGNRRFVSI